MLAGSMLKVHDQMDSQVVRLKCSEARCNSRKKKNKCFKEGLNLLLDLPHLLEYCCCSLQVVVR
jgi:hypothetical protein